MTNATLSAPVRQEWAFASPWLWMLPALCLSVVIVLLGGVDGGGFRQARLAMIPLAVLLAGIAATIRFQSNAEAFAAQTPSVSVPLLALQAGLFALACLGFTYLVVVGWIDDQTAPLKPGPATLLWLVAVPICALAAKQWLQRRSGSISITEERSLVLFASFFVSWACWRGFYFGADKPLEWDTFRMFFRSVGVFAFLGSGLVLLKPTFQRMLLSILATLHLGGICTAAFSAPPSPWIVGIIWSRIYRPYLEFMYLNNAYHFYAPEPGPASYLWFRLIYADAKGNEFGTWYKVPEIDDRGNSTHSVALEYQRFLAMTENTVHPEQAPPTRVVDQSSGEYVDAPYIRRRLDHLPGPLRIGRDQPKIVVPFHPFVPLEHQYSAPNHGSRICLMSFAKFVCHRPHPHDPSLTIQGVKIYRVAHVIPPYAPIAGGFPPTDPEFYRPYYMGFYRPDGVLADAEDPFLYWLLPILRDDSTEIESAIRNYAARHAGDPYWIRPKNQDRWVSE